MEQIHCPECKREVSDRAQACPHCGYPFEKTTLKKSEQTKKELKLVLIILVPIVLAITALLFYSLSRIKAKEGEGTMSSRHYEYALEAIGIVDKYLDGEISASEASDLMDALIERGEKLPEPDSLEKWDVNIKVLFLSTDLLSLENAPPDGMHDKILEDRNKLAELIGEKIR